MNKLHIITRCSRPRNLEHLLRSIFREAPSYKVLDIRWHIGFDMSRLDRNDLDMMSMHQHILNDRDLDGYVFFYEFNSTDNDIGHAFINKIVKDCVLTDEYFYVLDDDNIIHPNFYYNLLHMMEFYPEKDLIVFSQLVGKKDFSGLNVRTAKPENMMVSQVDMAQFCAKNIYHDFLTYNNYCADGIFLSNYYAAFPEKVVFNPTIMSFYNYLKL